MNSYEIKSLLQRAPEYRPKLYARGFLVTDADVKTDEHPFYGLWRERRSSKFSVLCAPGEQACFIEQPSISICLIGHAYNPFTGDIEEKEIVKKLADASADMEGAFFPFLNQLTGIFILCWYRDGAFHAVGDASCIQTTFYTVNNGRFFVSSHANLPGELLGLEWDEYIRRLVDYRFFKLFGSSLPGDLTQFSSVKRLVPNHFISFADGAWGCKRFYTPHKKALDFTAIVKKSIDILHNNLKLIAEKWQKPAISLTGGCDSRTTLACATGLLDKYRYFSYSSSEAEALDADSAREICEELGLTHRNYMVSRCDADYPGMEIVGKLLFWNKGSILPGNPNDVRKRCLFMDTEDFDVEVKSWCSEIGRAYYSKRFNGRINFGGKPTPRTCTTLYKVFFNNRSLVRETDKVFAEYLEKFFAQDESRPVEWQDQFFWEFRVPSWNGLVITGEHRISFDITIPYNNRLLLELLLSVDIRDRISDKLYWHVREMMNPAVNAHQLVVNQKHTRFRARLENLYYLFNTMLPF